MKYTILGFQQQKLIDIGLKVDDALILRTIKDMYSSASMEFITKENERYMWLNQKYFISQIPIIGSRSTLLRKIDIMADLELLVKLLKHSRRGQRGNFSYIRPTALLDSLQDYDPYVNLKQGLCQNETTLMSERHNKDTSIRDTSIKDNKDSSGGDYSKIVQAFQNNGFGLIHQGTKDILVDLIETYSSEWVLEALEISVKANVRKLYYAEGILKKWKAEGKDAEKPKLDPYDGVEVF